jgi:ABC-type spermidine/putrescine transport system permease subunit I
MQQIKTAFKKNVTSPLMRYVMFVLILMFATAPSFAQVTLSVPTDTIFTEANNWIAIFAPIFAIGIGISIAIAILTFVGKQITKAFSGGR